MNDAKKIITPKDFFLYISATLFLFLSAFSFLQFIFAVTNIAFPIVNEYYSGNYEMLRFALSLLIVSFPLFIFFTRKVNVYLHKNEAERENIIRKWLTYLTLFITTITSVITLVVLLNFFLDGEVTVRFIIKTISVLAVAAGVFSFYRKDLEGAWYTNPNKSKKIGYFVSLVVLIAIISGFMVIGSPAEQRKIKNDNVRIDNLRSLQYEVLDYWQRTEQLPQSLEVLDDPLRYTVIENDPVTNEQYEYSKKDDLLFELCADFETASKDFDKNYAVRQPSSIHTKGFLEENQDWQHDEGRTCFERTINPEIHTIR
jgi:hypothetical protein